MTKDERATIVIYSLVGIGVISTISVVIALIGMIFGLPPLPVFVGAIIMSILFLL